MAARVSPQERYQEAQNALSNLIQDLAVMNAVLGSGSEYRSVLPGWKERCTEIRDWADRQREEIIEFGSSQDT